MEGFSDDIAWQCRQLRLESLSSSDIAWGER